MERAALTAFFIRDKKAGIIYHSSITFLKGGYYNGS